jgi:beta-glucuronidase
MDGYRDRFRYRKLKTNNESHSCFICLFFAASYAYAKQDALIANTDGRKTVSLDGEWRTIVDPYETGYYNYRYQPSKDGYFKDANLNKKRSDRIQF